jgi:hypothetical protein
LVKTILQGGPFQRGQDITFFNPQPFPGRFRQGGILDIDQFARNLIEGSDDLASMGLEKNTAMRGKTLRTADRAIPSHEDDRFRLGIDTQSAGFQKVRPHEL